MDGLPTGPSSPPVDATAFGGRNGTAFEVGLRSSVSINVAIIKDLRTSSARVSENRSTRREVQ
jgi:hypothetical protein